MENLIIQVFAQTIFEMGKGAFSGNKLIADACIEPVVTSSNRIMKHLNKIFHVGKFFEIAEELQQEQADGVISKPQTLVLVSYNGPDK